MIHSKKTGEAARPSPGTGACKIIRTACMLTATICLLTSYTASAQPGALDLTFDGDGRVTVPVIAGADDNGYSVAIQSDGKIVVAGVTSTGPSDDFAVVRFSADGSLDSTFDTDGVVTTVIGSSSAIMEVVIQSDGKIVVAGYNDNGGNFDFAVVRYNSNGSLDTGFDSDGIVTTQVGNGDDRGYSVAIQSDGKIVVAGHCHNGTDYDFAVVRYNTNGSLDNAFDSDGMLITDIGTNDNAYSTAIQSDGKIVVTGNSFSGSWDFCVARYNTNGSLDNAFDSDGIALTDFGTSSYDIPNSVAIQSDGKIVVVGYTYIAGYTDFAVARYNTNGSLDNAFDGDGKVTTSLAAQNDDGFSVAIQTNGKIVVAGSSHDGIGYDFGLVRYNSNGSLDNTFDGDGIVTTAVDSLLDAGYSVAIQSDGKIVVAGFSQVGGSNDFAAARYEGDAISGVEENTEQVNVNVYPNPTNGQFIISCATDQPVEIEIYNALGERVYQSAIDPQTESPIDISSQPDGLYFYQVNNRDRIVATGKIVVQK